MANKLENMSLITDVKNCVERFEFYALANSWMGAVHYSFTFSLYLPGVLSIQKILLL